jgi:hypothetical protein
MMNDMELDDVVEQMLAMKPKSRSTVAVAPLRKVQASGFEFG